MKKDSLNQQALRDLDYIKQCEKNYVTYLNSAEFYIKSKNQGSAVEYLCRSIALDPANAEAHLLLAKQYEVQKNYQDAIVNYQMYLQLKDNVKGNVSDRATFESRIKYLEKSVKIIQ